MVLDGYVRDSARIQSLGFPMFCRGAAHVGAVKIDEGLRQLRVRCGGLVVEPGQLIFADSDGVVGVPLDAEEDVMDRTRAAHHRENRIRQQLDDGVSLLDALTTPLDNKGNKDV